MNGTELPDLVVRRLMVDLQTPIERRWCGADAFRSAWFNALSMSFPVGEQLFIDAVRDGMTLLPDSERERYAAVLKAFTAQEATHRRIHSLFNEHLSALGYQNTWAERIKQRTARMEGLDPRLAVAVTAATEHLTAIVASWLLRHPQALAGAEERIQAMWLWHAAEELEHRAVVFDLYASIGGTPRWRIHWFVVTTCYFLVDVLRQTLRNLRHDGQLFRLRTFRSAAVFLLGSHGLVRNTWRPWIAYLSRGFHPSQADGSCGANWLVENRDKAPPLRLSGE